MFFLIWGTKYFDKEVKKGMIVAKRCPKCRVNRDLFEFRKQKWFGLFFIPIFPYGTEKSSFLKCKHCNTDYMMSATDVDVNDNSRLIDFDDRIMVNCPSCKSTLKIKPLLSSNTQIKCGHCKHEFIVQRNYV